MSLNKIAAMALATLVIASGGAVAYHAGAGGLDYNEEDVHEEDKVGYHDHAEELEEDGDHDNDDSDDTDSDDNDSDDNDSDDNDSDDSDNTDAKDDSDNSDDSDSTDNSDNSDNTDSSDSTEEPSADDFSAHFTTDVKAGQSATLKITDNTGAPVDGVRVEVDDTQVGTTSADGTVTFQVPSSDDTIEVQYAMGGDQVEFEQHVSGAQTTSDSSQSNSDRDYSSQFTTDVVAGEQATLKVTYGNGDPVEGATVEVDNTQVGTTGADGTVTFTVPSDDDTIEVQVAHDGDENEFEQSVATK